MIKFQQKQFTEYDAMRALYVELMRYSDKKKFQTITPSELIPILRGNNVVIERFVVSHTKFGRDKFRMYLKVGAKAKMPDDVRLASWKVYDKKLADLSVSFKSDNKALKLFGNNSNNKKKGNNNNNNNDGGNGLMGGSFHTEVKSPFLSLSREVTELLGDAISYNKKDRSLVLEFNDIQSAIRALNILPFGLSYKIYLLDA